MATSSMPESERNTATKASATRRRTLESPAPSATQCLHLRNGHMGAAEWAAGTRNEAHRFQPRSPPLTE
ncbi:hypothetical protein E5288_WYG013030 [Bos mutus]|uniref:Uncharacterized protein n=1 Tax=Bos mutus TaxID=72004 RepID=A0A6B0R8X8_9CETA|nr:hypothetical protein [Bos mutus]